MDIKSIRSFVAIADHRGFQVAAIELGMSVSNISLQISALEKHLDVRLFDRSHRPPALTEAGVVFLNRCRQLLSDWDQLSNDVRGENSQGTLKIGAIHTAVSGGVSVALAALKSQHPALFLQLRTALTPELITLLQNQSIDCAVVTRPPVSIPDMVFHAIDCEPLAVISHRRFTCASFRETLMQNPYIRFNRQATLSHYIEGELDRRKLAVTPTMEVTTMDAVASLVANGLGVSIIPTGTTTPKLARSIRTQLLEKPTAFRELGLLFEKNCPRMHLVNHFHDVLLQTYKSSKKQVR